MTRSTTVQRIWKRDGSVNVMDVQVAALNLFSNTLYYENYEGPNRARKIEEALLRGIRLETPLAVFRVERVMSS